MKLFSHIILLNKILYFKIYFFDLLPAILQVETWLEELHDRRRLIEVSFKNRKTQLEQCLALALLATDLRDLEDILNVRIAALSSTSDHLGDSSASAELLLFECKKLQNEAKVYFFKHLFNCKKSQIYKCLIQITEQSSVIACNLRLLNSSIYGTFQDTTLNSEIFS